MKTVLILLLVAMAYPALADISTSAGKCYSITDPDYRTICRAKAQSEPGMCYSIQRNDLRGQCLAETK